MWGSAAFGGHDVDGELDEFAMAGMAPGSRGRQVTTRGPLLAHTMVTKQGF